MKNSSAGKAKPAHAWASLRNALLIAGLVGLGASMAISQAQAPTSPPPGGDGDEAGATVLTRGPVHEAFAGVISYNPEAGVVVGKAPPAPIEEMPPEEKPEGDNVTWIPGYWAWDDERNDYLWVSGTWRALPPGREWRAGYWSQTPQGYQWISGYWADAAAKETTYLPAPPATVEIGPNIAAPSDDYIWIPGCWIWIGGHYAWRPGYWVPGREDWDWFPSYYAWTPRGCVYVDGYWDYPVVRRGCVFAPVYFQPGIYVRHGFYSPRVVIGFSVFSDHLWVRPRYSHYYFGDYYATTYVSGGFYASFSFQSGRHGYDPIFSHNRWEHRRDREWEHRVEAAYQNRRDHQEARPPRTWAEERNIKPAAAGSRENRPVAMPFNQMANRKDGPVKFQPVAQPERQQLAQRGQEVQKSREDRRTIEAKGGGPGPRPAGGQIEPVKAELPRSPIVGKQASQLGRQAPPKAPQSPKPDSKFQPQSGGGGPGRQPEPNLSNPQKPDSEKQPRPPEAKPQPTRPPEVQPRPLPPEAKPQVPKPAESQPSPRPPEAQPRPLPPEAKPQPIRPPESQPSAVPPEAKPQPIRPAEAQPSPRPPEAQPRPLPPEAKPQPIRPPEAQPQPPRVSPQPPVRQRPDMGERGASRLMRNDRPASNKDRGR